MKRDFDVFATLWERYHGDIYRYLHTRLQNTWDVEDALQTTALKAAGSFDRLKDEKKAKSWFFAIAVNVIHDFYRKRKTEISIEAFPNIIADGDDRTQQYSDVRITVYEYVKKLPSVKQNLFFLYIQKSLTVKEIAKALDIGYSTARKWLSEIKDELAERIQG